MSSLTGKVAIVTVSSRGIDRSPEDWVKMVQQLPSNMWLRPKFKVET